MKDNDGFITVNLLIIILLITIIISSVSCLITSNMNLLKSYKRNYEKKQFLKTLFTDIEKDFQDLVNDDSDFYNSYTIELIEQKYKKYNLTVKDCSSGINESFFRRDFLDNPEVRSLINNDGDNHIVNYGWINSEWNEPQYVENLLAENINTNLPVINKMPLINVYNCSKELLNIILDYCNLTESEEKRNDFYNLIAECNFSKSNVMKIFEIKGNVSLFFILGSKTSFWNVTFEDEGKIGRGIIAAIPDYDGLVKEYKGIELYIE